jgi:hypothetical protein
LAADRAATWRSPELPARRGTLPTIVVLESGIDCDFGYHESYQFNSPAQWSRKGKMTDTEFNQYGRMAMVDKS